MVLLSTLTFTYLYYPNRLRVFSSSSYISSSEKLYSRLWPDSTGLVLKIRICPNFFDIIKSIIKFPPSQLVTVMSINLIELNKKTFSSPLFRKSSVIDIWPGPPHTRPHRHTSHKCSFFYLDLSSFLSSFAQFFGKKGWKKRVELTDTHLKHRYIHRLNIVGKEGR